MKRLKTKQSHGCDFCREGGVTRQAKWRNHGFSKCACDEHKPVLQLKEDRQRQMDSYQTEAEFQLGV